MDGSSPVRIEDPKAGDERGNFLESGGRPPHQEASKHRGFLFSTVAGKVTLVLAVMGVTWVMMNLQSSYQLFPPQNGENLSSFPAAPGACDSAAVKLNDVSSPPKLQQEKEEKSLKNTLSKAAMADGKTVIITTLNAAWTEPNSIFDLFLESFRIGNQTQNLLRHVVVAAFDQTAYARCSEAHLHCYALTTHGVNFTGEAHFMSEDYLKMMWRRIDFLWHVLELGFNFVFTDADVLWLRNPFDRFYADGDFQIACDHYWYNSTDTNNSPNGGFNYVKSSNRTIEFYKFWYRGKDYFPGRHDQDVLNMIKELPSVRELGLQMRFLDTANYGGFCEPSKDLDLVVTMHANCCIGIENKVHDISMAIDDWKRYMAAAVADGGVVRNSSLRSWTMPRRCG